MEKAGPPPSYSDVPPPSNPSYNTDPGYPPQGAYPPAQVAPPGVYPPQTQGYPQQYPPTQQGYQQPPYPPQAQVQQPYYPQGVPAQTQPQVEQKTVTVVTSFGNCSQRMNCVNCRTEQTSLLRRRVGAMNWIVCGITAVVLLILSSIFFFPILCVPFALFALCIPSLMDTDHVCPNCNHLNGVHRAA